MHWRSSFSLFISLLVFGCSQATKEVVESAAETADTGYYTTDNLIEAEELANILRDPQIKVVDFRKDSDYKVEHIDGAVNIWRPDIEDHTYPFDGMMADQQQVADLLGSRGIKSTDALIVYDNRGSADAARFWWVLQNYGFERVQILNGGLAAWKKMGREVTAKHATTERTEFQFLNKPSRQYVISRDELLELLETNENLLLLDTRSADEYSGKRRKNGAKKAGRIIGSEHMDWQVALNLQDDMKFKSFEELSDQYASLEEFKDKLVVTYCHTGVRSAHTTFVLTQLLGFKNVRNYDGSWTEWSFHDNLPLEQDSVTATEN